jgi:hypothetical protein
MCNDFEIFITSRFLDFYNKENDTNFIIKEKRDEIIRNELSYDYHCADTKTNHQMGIEVKRLIPKEREFEAKIKNWIML